MPAIVAAIPVFVFNYFFINHQLDGFIDGVLKPKLIFNISISIAILYFFSEACRFIGKNWFERRYFSKEEKMPTTNFLLYSDNHYSEQFKDKIREKIFSDFSIPLPSKQNELTSELSETRKKIVEVMALIRKKLHINKFLLQHNIEYGALRNLIGGSPLGALFSVFNILFFSLYFKIKLVVYISVGMLALYLLIILLSKVIMEFYADNYARTLYREYIS